MQHARRCVAPRFIAPPSADDDKKPRLIAEDRDESTVRVPALRDGGRINRQPLFIIGTSFQLQSCSWLVYTTASRADCRVTAAFVLSCSLQPFVFH